MGEPILKLSELAAASVVGTLIFGNVYRKGLDPMTDDLISSLPHEESERIITMFNRRRDLHCAWYFNSPDFAMQVSRHIKQVSGTNLVQETDPMDAEFVEMLADDIAMRVRSAREWMLARANTYAYAQRIYNRRYPNFQQTNPSQQREMPSKWVATVFKQCYLEDGVNLDAGSFTMRLRRMGFFGLLKLLGVDCALTIIKVIENQIKKRDLEMLGKTIREAFESQLIGMLYDYSGEREPIDIAIVRELCDTPVSEHDDGRCMAAIGLPDEGPQNLSGCIVGNLRMRYNKRRVDAKTGMPLSIEQEIEYLQTLESQENELFSPELFEDKDGGEDALEAMPTYMLRVEGQPRKFPKKNSKDS